MYDFVGGETLQLLQDIGVEKDTFTCFNKVRIYFHIYLTLQVPNTTIAEFANTVEDGTQLGQSFFIFRFTDPPDPIFWKLKKK